MSAPLQFTKYEGLGNDFIVVESLSLSLDGGAAERLCDRHFGVGADGVLLVLPSEHAQARARMVVLNADGSRPEMCGNGLRCVALHLALADGKEAAHYLIETDAGLKAAKVESAFTRPEVTLGMGRAVLGGQRQVKHAALELGFQEVSMGNPHTITFDGTLDTASIDRVSPLLSAEVPGGTNVEFARIVGPNRIELVVWERGVGRTLACGTGAAATAAAAAVLGHVAYGEAIQVMLPGGALELRVEAGSLEVELKGPARLVFRGSLVQS
jgi:diaminopimelate epimerase